MDPKIIDGSTGPRPGRPTGWRLRVRTLLLVVAAVAFAIEGSRMVGRWSLCRQRARIMSGWTTAYRETAGAYDRVAEEMEPLVPQAPRRGIPSDTWAGKHRDTAQEYRDIAGWCDRLRVLYEAGQARPWRSIPPEPPRPAPKLARFWSIGWD